MTIKSLPVVPKPGQDTIAGPTDRRLASKGFRLDHGNKSFRSWLQDLATCNARQIYIYIYECMNWCFSLSSNDWLILSKLT